MAIISRRQYDHPALATAGGSALHASISNLYTVLGDDSMSRYKTFTAVANSSVGVIAHEFGLDFANLKVQIFTGTYPALTLVSDPIGTGWTVAATSGLASRSIDVTAPASGGPHTYAVLVSHESNATAFIPGLVSIGAQSFAGPKTFTGTLFGTDITDSSSSTTGAFKTAGGMGVARALFVGDTLNTAGAATLGASTTSAVTHTFQGTGGVAITGSLAGSFFAKIRNVSNTATTDNASLRIWAGGTSAGSAHTMYFTGSGSYSWQSGVNCATDTYRVAYNNVETLASPFLECSTAGAWTFGATSTTTHGGQAHVYHGGLNSGATGLDDADKRFIINCNAYNSVGGTAYSTRNSNTNTLGGIALQLIARTSDTTAALNVIANIAASGNTTQATSILECSQSGIFKFGANSPIIFDSFVKTFQSTSAAILTLSGFTSTVANSIIIDVVTSRAALGVTYFATAYRAHVFKNNANAWTITVINSTGSGDITVTGSGQTLTVTHAGDNTVANVCNCAVYIMAYGGDGGVLPAVLTYTRI